jgi:hypothetical protein
MNNLQKVLLSIIGGIDTTFKILTPLLLSVIFVSMGDLTEIGTYTIYILGGLACLFRAIKIGWMKND